MGRREEAGWSVGKEVEAVGDGRGRTWVGGAWVAVIRSCNWLLSFTVGIQASLWHFHGLSEL